MIEKLQRLTREDKSYIAGFLDGDGCINAQIISNTDYVLKFQIRVTVTFFQKSRRAYFLECLKDKIGAGTLRDNRGVVEYTIVGVENVTLFFKEFQPMLRLKSEQAKIVLQICEALSEGMQSRNQQKFIDLCELVDRVGEFNDSTTKNCLIFGLLRNPNIQKAEQ